MSKTNNLSQIPVPKSGFKRSRFNWTHDVNTTFSWGEIQPTQCKLLVPNSKTTMSAQNLIRLAPLVAPTFGRVKYKTYNQFVGLSEIFPNLGSLLSQEPITTAYGTQVVKNLPSVKLGQLSAWVLFGARATLYYVDPDAPDPAAEMSAGHYLTSYRKRSLTTWSYPPIMSSSLNHIHVAGVYDDDSADVLSSATNGVLPDLGTRAKLYLHEIPALAEVFDAGDFVPLASKSANDWIPVDRGDLEPKFSNGFYVVGDYQSEVTFDSADYVIEFSVVYEGVTYYYALAFECSDFGKRMRKIIQGCGYQVDFGSKTYVSILPILAQYKAYFDVFGLQLYQGWETTYCSRLIKYIENNFIDFMAFGHNGLSIVPNDSALDSINNSNCFLAFMLNEVGNEWYTDDVDYISAHQEKLAVSPKPDATPFISVSSTGTIKSGANITAPASTGADGVSTSQEHLDENGISGNTANQVHAYINQLQHGQVDATLLMRFYRWTNRNSILGRAIEKILIAQNLGWYVEACKSNFIGSSDVLVTISDVVSQAATDDAVLGEFGGKGLQYTSDGTLTFENKEYGYWITLATIVPQSGYTQGIDPTLTSLKKFDLYHADFDAIGMEITPKDVVVGCKFLIQNSSDYTGRDGFGFIPRMSKFKVHQNLVNGDFNRHGKRNVYLPYTLDKQINVNDFAVKSSGLNTTGDYVKGFAELQRSVTCGAMPIAGNVWRMPTKFPWLGHFDRIFYNVGKRDDSAVTGEDGIEENACIGFSDFNDDNFLSHGIYDVKCYAPMKPIEESYGLGDEDNPTAGVDFNKKA